MKAKNGADLHVLRELLPARDKGGVEELNGDRVVRHGQPRETPQRRRRRLLQHRDRDPPNPLRPVIVCETPRRVPR